MKKVFSAVSAALALTTALTSCSAFVRDIRISGDTAPTSAPSAAVTKVPVSSAEVTYYTPAAGLDPKTALDQLADTDCEGDIFLIATVTSDSIGKNPIWQTEDMTTYASAAARISAVSDKYTLKIAPFTLDYDKLVPTLAENIKNYAYTADLLVVPASLAETLISEKLVLNLSKTAFFDRTAYYFDSSVTDFYNGDDCYAVYGDALCPPEATLCVYYNKKLAASAGADDLFSLCKNGRWELDSLVSLAEKGSLATDIPLPYLIQSIYGRTYSEIFAKDGSLLKPDKETAAIIDSITGRLGEKLITENAKEAFKEGGSLFYIGRIDEAAELAETCDAWSLLPIPLAAADEKAVYPTVYDNREEKWLFLVPKDAAISERSVQVMSALCAATCDEAKIDLRKSLYGYMRTNDARIMLDSVLAIGTRRSRE